MHEIFGPYLIDFMQISLDDLSVFGARLQHIQHLQLCFQQCREVLCSLNTMKCAFAVQIERLLGHVILSKGIVVDLDKVIVVMQALALATLKECLGFLGQIR